MVRHAMMRQPMMTKATMRTAQPKPTTGMSCSRMMGNTTPPLALPPVVSPIARARRRRNQCPRTATAGLNLYGYERSARPSGKERGLQEGDSNTEQNSVGEENLVRLVFFREGYHHKREHRDDGPCGYEYLPVMSTRILHG